MTITLAKIADLVGGMVIGNQQTSISHLASLENIDANSLVWVESPAKLSIAEQSSAAALLVESSIHQSVKPLIQVNNSRKAFIYLLSYFNPSKSKKAFIHPTAILASKVILGNNVTIGPYTVIGEGCSIGNNCIIKSHVHLGDEVQLGNDCVIYPQVTIYDGCKLGNEVIVHASSVIGSDGFGYHFSEGQHLKVPHVGTVIIEDNVEIGANTTIDKAVLDATVIGAGTKIDNLVQIAHSVKLGKNNILCAFTGIAGSVVTGNQVVFAARVGVGDHAIIEDEVTIAGGSGVASNKRLKKGNIYFGLPARPLKKSIELETSLTKIPFLRKQLQSLKSKVATLEAHLTIKE